MREIRHRLAVIHSASIGSAGFGGNPMFHVLARVEVVQATGRKLQDRHCGWKALGYTATPNRSYSMPRIDHSFSASYGAYGARSLSDAMVALTTAAALTVGSPALAFSLDRIHKRGGEPSTAADPLRPSGFAAISGVAGEALIVQQASVQNKNVRRAHIQETR